MEDLWLKTLAIDTCGCCYTCLGTWLVLMTIIPVVSQEQTKNPNNEMTARRNDLYTKFSKLLKIFIAVTFINRVSPDWVD